MKTISLESAMKLATKKTAKKQVKSVAKKATPRKTVVEEPKKKRGRPTKQEQVKKALKELNIPSPEPPPTVEVEEKEEPRPRFKSSKPTNVPIINEEAFKVLWLSKSGNPAY